jgi:Flp pilus assembly protein protease CpaA
VSATAGITLMLLLVATVIDLRRREIPDWVAIALFVVAAASRLMSWTSEGWLSLALGSVLAFALSLLLFWRGAMGGGDAKVLTALGAVLGPGQFMSMFFYVALAGGLLALAAIVRGKREIAYAPAIALGFLALVLVQGLSE